MCSFIKMGFFHPLDSLLYQCILVYSIFCKQIPSNKNPEFFMEGFKEFQNFFRKKSPSFALDFSSNLYATCHVTLFGCGMGGIVGHFGYKKPYSIFAASIIDVRLGRTSAFTPKAFSRDMIRSFTRWALNFDQWSCHVFIVLARMTGSSSTYATKI